MSKLMLLFLLAQGGVIRPSSAMPSSKIYNWSVRDMILVVGVAVVIANLLFLWAYLSRQNRRRQLGPYSRALRKSEKGAAGASSGRSHSRRHRRKRRPDHPANLPRNPSLAEAGGLPPLRQDEAPPAKPAT